MNNEIIDVLNEFSQLGNREKVVAHTIQYDFIDNNFDLFVVNSEQTVNILIESGSHKMHSISNKISMYNKFFKYMVDKKLRDNNPMDSNYFSFTYLCSEIIENGNIKLYSYDWLKQYVMDKPVYNKEYYLMLISCIYDGIKSSRILTDLVKSDVDENGYIEKYKVQLSDRTLNLVNQVNNMPYYETNDINFYYADTEFYIRRVLAKGRKTVKGTSGLFVTDRLWGDLTLSLEDLYDSGLISRFINKFGIEKFYYYLLDSGINKRGKAVLNALEDDLRSIYCYIKPVDFIYDYKIYAVALRSGAISLD